MTVILLFLAVIAGIAGWWLSQQRLLTKPWLDVGSVGDVPAWQAPSLPSAKVGLGVFLAVAGCVFSLLVGAYLIRVDLAATTGGVVRGLPTSRLLWVNTGALLLSSATLHYAQSAARRGQRDAVRDALLFGGLFTFVFLAGQMLVWRQLVDEGYFAASNPANAFFYLLTGVHAVHVAGGLVALGRSIAKVWQGVSGERLHLSVWLCAVYWHFLLLVWLVIFALLAGWADDFISICRGLVV